MRTLTTKLISLLIMASFVVIVLFGFMSMTHTQGGSMEGNCPFAIRGGSVICPQDSFGMVARHVDGLRSFLSVSPVSIFATLLSLTALISFLFLTVFVVTGPPQSFLTLLSRQRRSGLPPKLSFSNKLTRWLSLLEHSPAYI